MSKRRSRLEPISRFIQSLRQQGWEIRIALKENLDDIPAWTKFEKERNAKKVASPPVGRVRELESKFLQSTETGFAQAQAAIVNLPAPFPAEWLKRLKRLRGLHLRLLRAGVAAQERRQELSEDLLSDHDYLTSRAARGYYQGRHLGRC